MGRSRGTKRYEGEREIHETDGLNPARPAGRAHAFVTTLALALLTLSATPTWADDINLVETGSSLLYPLFNVWASEYMKTHPGVHIITGSAGSGAGIKEAISGAVQIGASDAYMSDAQTKRYPQIINVPMAIAAVTVNYNLPDLNTTALKLSGPVLAGIYTGKIRAWDDEAIAFLNQDVKLPHHDIISVHRADESGDTFIFTQYLTFTTSSWEDNLGFGTSITWPDVPGSASAKENSGMLQKIQETPYSIAYIGVSFHTEIAKAGLGTAALKSYSGEFLLPTPETIAAAAASLTPRTPPDERLTLVNAPGARAYPLINYEYTAGLSPHQLRIYDRLDQAGEPGDRRSDQEISALGHRARRNQRKISRRRPLHRLTGPHLGVESRSDRENTLVVPFNPAPNRRLSCT